MSNRLPILAVEIRKAHADVQDAAKTAAERAIAAGHALIEAKALVKHGEWLPWLRANCALAERTAQLYMKLAERGVNPATVAALGLSAASKVLHEIYDEHYNPFAHCDDEQRRQWGLYVLFGVNCQHVEWILQRQFLTPDDWHGPAGQQFRNRCGLRGIPEAVLGAWRRFRDERAGMPLKEVEAAAEAVTLARDDMAPVKARKRRRRAA